MARWPTHRSRALGVLPGLVLLTLALAPGGCSDDDGDAGGSCGFDACGGNPTGDWTADSTCGDLTAQIDSDFSDGNPSCEGAVRSASLTSYTVTLNIGPNGGYTQGGEIGLALSVSWDEDCLSELFDRSVELDNDLCEGLPALFATVYRSASGSCTLSGNGACQCELELEADAGELGTYELTGSDYRRTNGVGDLENGQFCVRDGELLTRSSNGFVTVYRAR